MEEEGLDHDFATLWIFCWALSAAISDSVVSSDWSASSMEGVHVPGWGVVLSDVVMDVVVCWVVC